MVDKAKDIEALRPRGFDNNAAKFATTNNY
jgi:hypothetical protein